MKDIEMEMEIKNDAVLPIVQYLESAPVTKQHFRSTNRVTEKRSANNVTGNVILLTPISSNGTGSTKYKIGICDIVVAWSMQLRDTGLVIFTSKNIDEIIAKYNVSMKIKFINLANTVQEATEDKATLLKLEFLQASVENDVCIPKHTFQNGETEKRAPSSDVPASPDSATSTTGVVPGRPATT
jgi:hypothetical protein